MLYIFIYFYEVCMQNYIKEIINICGLPFDEIMSMHKVLQIGSHIVYIANYKKILSYGDNSIDLKLSKGMLRIEGEELKIKQMDKGEIVICGKIKGVWDGDYDKK